MYNSKERIPAHDTQLIAATLDALLSHLSLEIRELPDGLWLCQKADVHEFHVTPLKKIG